MATETTTVAPVERPAPPPGHLYLQDVLDVVREYADRFGWCGDAEETAANLFGFHRHDDLRRRRYRAIYCCASCNGSREEWERNNPMPDNPRRMTLVDPLRTVPVARVKDGIRETWADEDSDDIREACQGVVDRLNLPVRLGD